MPDIQNAVGSAVDFVLGKIDDITASIKDMTCRVSILIPAISAAAPLEFSIAAASSLNFSSEAR